MRLRLLWLVLPPLAGVALYPGISALLTRAIDSGGSSSSPLPADQCQRLVDSLLAHPHETTCKEPDRALAACRQALQADPAKHPLYAVRWELMEFAKSPEQLVAQVRADLREIEQHEIAADQAVARIKGNEYLFYYIGDQSKRSLQGEILTQYLDAHPEQAVAVLVDLATFFFSRGNLDGGLAFLQQATRLGSSDPQLYRRKWKLLARKAGEDSLFKPLLIEDIRLDLESIRNRIASADRRSLERQACEYLYRATRDRVHLQGKIDELKQGMAASPRDAAVQREGLLQLGELAGDPRQALGFLRRAATLMTCPDRLERYYRLVMRLESASPGALSTDELTAFFRAWDHDMDTLNVGLARRPGAPADRASTAQREYEQHLVDRTGVEYCLWRAEMAWQHGQGIDATAYWLDQTRRRREEATDGFFELYVDPRLELRSGDVAYARFDPTTAQSHYARAWALIGPSEQSWGTADAADIGDLRELSYLGTEIKARLADGS